MDVPLEPDLALSQASGTSFDSADMRNTFGAASAESPLQEPGLHALHDPFESPTGFQATQLETMEDSPPLTQPSAGFLRMPLSLSGSSSSQQPAIQTDAGDAGLPAMQSDAKGAAVQADAGDGGDAAEQPSDQKPDTAMSADQKLLACENYQKHNNLPALPDLQDVIGSGQGVNFFLTCHLDMSARSNMSQVFQRALKKSPKWAELYPHMTDELKLEFRRAWSIRRDWDFTKETREISSINSKKTQDLGEMLPVVSIAAAIGDCRDPECQALAKAYVEQAIEVGGKFVGYNSFMKTPVYLFIRRLMSSSSVKEWRQTVESSKSENLWDARAKQCRAITNFAIMAGRKVDSVSLEEVVESSIGLDGWAASFACGTVAKAGAKAGGKAGAKGGAKAGAKVGGRPSNMALEDGEDPSPKVPKATKANPVAKAEREAKELLSKITALDNERVRLQQHCDENPDSMSWAETFLATMKALDSEIQLSTGSMGNFVADFKAHALSATGMRTLKKTFGDTYLEKLLLFKATFEEKANRLDDTVTTVRRMLSASVSSSPPAKRKGATAGGTSNSGKKARGSAA
jgi:hypothetical protein